MSDKQRALTNAVLLTAGTLAELLLSYAFIVILTRSVGPAGLGEYYYIISIVTLVILLYIFNNVELLQKKIAQCAPGLRGDLGRYLMIRTFLALLSGLIILVLAAVSSRSMNFKIALAISSCYAVTGIYINLFEGIAKSHQNILPIVLGRFLERIMALVLLLWFVHISHLDIVYLIVIVTLGGFLQTFILLAMIKRYLVFSIERSLGKIRDLFRQSSPFIFASIFASIFYKTDVVMLGYLTSNEEVGYYAAAHQIFSICFMTIGIVNTIVFPPFMKLYLEDKQKYRAAVDDLMRLVFYYIVGLSIGLGVLSQKIIPFVFGPALNPSIWVLQAFSIILFFAILIPLYSTLLTSMNRQALFSVIIGLTAMINLVANYFLIRKYSYHGAVYSTLVSNVLCFLLCVISLLRSNTIRIHFRGGLKILIAAGFMVLVLRQSSDAWPLVMHVLLGFASYTGMLIALRYFTPEDYEWAAKWGAKFLGPRTTL